MGALVRSRRRAAQIFPWPLVVPLLAHALPSVASDSAAPVAVGAHDLRDGPAGDRPPRPHRFSVDRDGEPRVSPDSAHFSAVPSRLVRREGSAVLQAGDEEPDREGGDGAQPPDDEDDQDLRRHWRKLVGNEAAASGGPVSFGAADLTSSARLLQGREQVQAVFGSGIQFIPSGKLSISQKGFDWLQNDIIPRIFAMFNGASLKYTEVKFGGFHFTFNNTRFEHVSAGEIICDLIPKKGIHIAIRGLQFYIRGKYKMGGDSWLNFLFSSEGEVQSELLRGNSGLNAVFMPSTNLDGTVNVNFREFALVPEVGDIHFSGSWVSALAKFFVDTSRSMAPGDFDRIVQDGMQRVATEMFQPQVRNLTFNLTIKLDPPYDILMMMFTPCCFGVHEDRLELGVRGAAVAPAFAEFQYPSKPPSIPMDFVTHHKGAAVTFSPWVVNTGLYLFWKIGFFDFVITRKTFANLIAKEASQLLKTPIPPEIFIGMVPLNKFSFCPVVSEWCIPDVNRLLAIPKALIDAVKNGEYPELGLSVYVFGKVPEAPKVAFKNGGVRLRIQQHLEFSLDATGKTPYQFMLKVPIEAHCSFSTDNSGPYPKVNVEVNTALWEVQLGDTGRLRVDFLLEVAFKFWNEFIGLIEDDIILPAINYLLRNGFVIQDEGGFGIRNLHTRVTEYFSAHFDPYWDVERSLRESFMSDYMTWPSVNETQTPPSAEPGDQQQQQQQPEADQPPQQPQEEPQAPPGQPQPAANQMQSKPSPGAQDSMLPPP